MCVGGWCRARDRRRHADGPGPRLPLLLQDHPGITADALGERLGVTERAARRYVGLLRDAGIPVESVRGPYGGYRLGRGLRLPPLMFSAAEALGLVMAVLDGHHDAGDDDSPVGSALAKILRGLPAPVAEQAAAVRRAAAAAPDRGAARPDPAVTTALVEACSAARRVRVGYRSESGKEWEAEVDPWAVVVRHGRWYLLCLDHRSDGRRAYRIDRMSGVRLLDDAASAPDGLDPVAELEDHLAVGWEFTTEVRGRPAARPDAALAPARARTARGRRRRPHPAHRVDQQPAVVRRPAGGAARLPDPRRPGAAPRPPASSARGWRRRPPQPTAARSPAVTATAARHATTSGTRR